MNDLSLAGQFRDIQSFHVAVAQLMRIRQEIHRLGSSLYCHRNLAYAQVTAGAVMQQAIQGLPMPQRSAGCSGSRGRARTGRTPDFHGADDLLEAEGIPVNNTAIGEAAICCYRGVLRKLVSFSPSDWLFTPVTVKWLRDDESEEDSSASLTIGRSHRSRHLWRPIRLASRLGGILQRRCSGHAYASLSPLTHLCRLKGIPSRLALRNEFRCC